ncbi:hypothetical protein EAI30_18875 [Romboutsia ilealis]|nr:hypothetical protein [Romboutsia ilealis]
MEAIWQAAAGTLLRGSSAGYIYSGQRRGAAPAGGRYSGNERRLAVYGRGWQHQAAQESAQECETCAWTGYTY